MSRYLLYSIVLICLISFYSCSENSVDPNNEISFDSARYDWTRIYINPFIIDVQAYDSSHVYLLNTGSLFIYDGNQVTHLLEMGFGVSFFEVISPNEIYFLSSSKSEAKIYKYSNGNINAITEKIDTNLPAFSFEYVNNNFWIGSYFGNVYNISNNIITKYQVDPECLIVKIRSVNNEVYCCGLKDSNNKTVSVRYYKLNGNTFEMIYEAPYNENSIFPTLDNISDVFLASLANQGFYKLIGNNFEQFINMYGFTVSPYIGGIINNYTITARYDNQPDYLVYNWNGQKFSKEIPATQFAGSPFKIEFKNNRIYIVNTYDLFNTLIFSGKLKQ